jgi:hypothetical protein
MRIGDLAFQRRTEASGRLQLFGAFVCGAVLGTAWTYFWDGERGRLRRHLTRDKFASRWRGTTQAFESSARFAAAETYGASQRISHAGQQEWSVPNDVALADRVKTKLFGDPRIPAGRISVNAEAGIVVLRGELDRPDQIRDVEDAVNRLPGVRGVHNLLHLQGTPVLDRGSVLPAP